jgi:polyhydroxyalkanoate synthesis regulator phasin
VASRSKKATGVPDAVRRAVERTFQSTLGSGPLTRERAQELADDVLRRAEEGAVRAGRGVRKAGVRQREAAAGVGDRLRDAITEIRSIGGDEISQLRSEVEQLRRRVDDLERQLAARKTKSPKSGSAKSAKSGSKKKG